MQCETQHSAQRPSLDLKWDADRTLLRFFILASWLTTFVDGTLKLITNPDPLVAGETNYTVFFARDSGDPEHFDNVELFFGATLTAHFPLRFSHQTLGPFNDEDLHHFTFDPGCASMHSQHTRNKLYLA